MEIKVNQKIPLSRISDMLVNAFEGGSNYWYMIEKKTAPKTWDYLDEMRPRNGKHWIQEYPLNERGEIIITSQEEESDTKGRKIGHRLNLHTIQQGLQIMADKFPKHFGDFMSEDDDADTADVFLQCCLFKDVIYS